MVFLLNWLSTASLIDSDKVGKFTNYPPEIQKCYVLLDALKSETAKKTARDNFLSILPKWK